MCVGGYDSDVVSVSWGIMAGFVFRIGSSKAQIRLPCCDRAEQG
jgi:hypothetical protein